MVLNAFFTIYRYVDFNVFVCVLCMCFRICKWFARSITNSGHKQLTSRKDKKTINLLLFPTIGNCSLYDVIRRQEKYVYMHFNCDSYWILLYIYSIAQSFFSFSLSTSTSTQLNWIYIVIFRCYAVHNIFYCIFKVKAISFSLTIPSMIYFFILWQYPLCVCVFIHLNLWLLLEQNFSLKHIKLIYWKESWIVFPFTGY